MAPNIYWVGGGKGGVGKSVLSIALLDHLLGKGVPRLFLESDTSNPDMYKAYREALPCELADLDRVDGWIQVEDTCDSNRDKAVVVNMPARSNAGAAKFGSTLGTSLPELGARWWGYGRSTGTATAWSCSRISWTRCPSASTCCGNLYFGDESKFELYATSKAVRPRVESGGGKTLSFPDLADRVADDLGRDDRARLSPAALLRRAGAVGRRTRKVGRGSGCSGARVGAGGERPGTEGRH